jgi:hypothetical protein
VDGSYSSINVGRTAETGAVRLVELGRLGGGWIDFRNVVHKD